MKRKIKKYAEGKAVTTRSDDEIEWANSKPMGGAGQQYPGEGWKQREKEQGEKNWSAIKNFFGGKKESSSSKFDELESVGGAGRRPRTIEEQIGRKAEEKPTGIASGFKSDQSVFKRQDNEVKLPNKAVSISKEKTTVTAPNLAKTKVGKGYEGVSRSLRGSEKVGKGYEGLDLRDKKSSTDGLGTAAAVLAGLGGLGLASMKGNMKRSNDNRSNLRGGIKTLDPSQPDYLDEARFADEGNPNFKRGGKVKAKSKMSYGGKVKKMASGGKSASARADGCAIRGKTRA